MPVYAYRAIEEVKTSLKSLAEKVAARLTLNISGEEFLQAFVVPEHVTAIRGVMDLVGMSDNNARSTVLATSRGYRFQTAVTFSGSAPILIPQYVSGGLARTCPDALRERIIGWTDDRARFGLAFGDVMDSLDFLNNNCGDLKAMSIFSPCLPSIIRNISDDADSRSAKRARSLASSNRFGKLPKMAPEAKARLLEASAVINSATLLLEAPVPGLKRHDATFQLVGFANGSPGPDDIINGHTRSTFF